MTTGKLWFFVNSASAKVAKKGALLPGLVKAFGANLHDVGDFSDIDAVALNCLADGPSHIVIEGGDGTVQGVLTAFMRQAKTSTLPIFILVPGGNTNQVARNVGLTSATEPALRRALSPNATLTHTPLLRLKSATGQKLYGFLFSTGALPQVTDFTHSQLHERGIGGSLAVIGGILKGVMPGSGKIISPSKIKIKIKIKADPDISIKGQHLGTIVTTLPGLILNLDPFWGEGEWPLRVTYVHGQYKKLIRNVASLWVGNKSRDRAKDGMQSWTATGLNYKYKGPIVLDGEVIDFGGQAFKVRATKPLRFAR